MKQVKKWVYYCDFCGKRSLRSLEEHEKHCTMNPERSCRFCNYTETQEEKLPELMEKIRHSIVNKIEFIDDDLSYETGDREPRPGLTPESLLKSLHELSDCPTCILAAMRQTKTAYIFKSCFDFQKEKESIFAEHNQDVDHYWY